MCSRKTILTFSLRLQIHLALYSFANGQVSVSLRLLYRARYLALLVYGEDHPEVALLDVSTMLITLNLIIIYNNEYE